VKKLRSHHPSQITVMFDRVISVFRISGGIGRSFINTQTYSSELINLRPKPEEGSWRCWGFCKEQHHHIMSVFGGVGGG
jgi:hypothetical protein